MAATMAPCGPLFKKGLNLGISWSFGAWLPVLRRLPGGVGQVALTIDDAPMADTTPMLLDLLHQHQAKATFFLSGCRIENQQPLIAEMVRRGHAIYAHGWEHIRLDRAGTQRMIADMDRCEAVLRQFRPTPQPYLVRLPQNGGYRNTRVHRALRAWMPGCQFAHWGLSTEDHLIPTRCIAAIDVARECQAEVDRLLADSRLPGAIVLMHDQPINERPGAAFKPAVTVTLLRLLLEGMSARGLTSVPLIPASRQVWWSRFILP